MAHDQPTYASVPGIRVFGMMCVKPGMTKRKPPPNQAPKRDQFYQQQQLQSQQHPYGNQHEQTYTSPSSLYNQGYHQQNQYQSNYQYLHRTPDISSRPFLSSTLRPQYHNDQVTLNQYDDVYGRTKDVEAASAAGASAAPLTSEAETAETAETQQATITVAQLSPSTPITTTTSSTLLTSPDQLETKSSKVQSSSRNKRNIVEMNKFNSNDHKSNVKLNLSL